MFLNNLINFQYSSTGNFFLIAGPCVIENETMAMEIAVHIKQVAERHKVPFIFKASYKKANRSKKTSFTGIGDNKALQILAEIKNTLQVPVLTDVHSPTEAIKAAAFVDILQIPAFLCRQSDLLEAAAQTGKIVNIKKGQFLSPEAMRFAADKVVESGNNQLMLTERGVSFGYHDLVVDYRAIPIMQQFGFPVVLDVTHSLQVPNQTTGVTGGTPHFIDTIACAGIAAGADGLFIETHPDPANAKSDGANMLKLSLLDGLLGKLVKVRAAIIQ